MFSAAGDRRVAQSRSAPNRFADDLFTGLPSRYDVLAEVLGLGQYHRWHAALVDAIMPAVRLSRVLDVATGTGSVALQLARRTSAEVIGLDLTEQMLRRARARVRKHAAPVELVRGRAERLPFGDGEFDAVTFTFLLRYVADPAATLAELARVVRPGGLMAGLEFGVPPDPVWRAAWTAYTRVVLPVGGGVSGGRAWWDVGRFLGPSITEHYRQYPIEWAVRAWEAAGMEQVSVRRLSLGGGLVISGRRRQ